MMQAGVGKASTLVYSLTYPHLLSTIHSSKFHFLDAGYGDSISKILKWCSGTTDVLFAISFSQENKGSCYSNSSHVDR